MLRCVNSDHIHFETYRETLLELVPEFNNGEPISREFYDTYMSGRQNPELVASIFPDMPLEEQTKLWTTKEGRYEDIITRGVPPVNGLPALLDFCERKNLVTYVVTNAPKGSCMKTMKSIGISDHFASRVVVAEECERPKPDPAPYLRGLKLADVSPSEAIAFEDSPSGTKSATGAGILTIGMRSTQTDETLRAAGATFTVPDYTAPELLEALSMWTS